MNLHSFNPDVAQKVGVNAAVVYQNIVFWTRKNLANGKRIHDGKVWTYNSVKALGELFPYLTASQLRTATQKLVDAGLIYEGNFNQSAYDRTKWYGVSTDLHLRKSENGNAENREPIPDSKPDSNTDTIGQQTELLPPDPKPSKPKRACQLPDGWVPNERNIKDAADRNFSQQEIDHEADQFRNYHHAKGTTFKNWDAAWRTWLGNARKFSRGPSVNTATQSISRAASFDRSQIKDMF